MVEKEGAWRRYLLRPSPAQGGSTVGQDKLEKDWPADGAAGHAGAGGKHHRHSSGVLAGVSVFEGECETSHA